jgi:hypothetical protein
MGRTISGKIRSTVLLLAMLLLAAIFVLATGTAPYFTPTPPSAITCYQNSTCFYDFNATDDQGDPYNFSIDTPPFMSSKIDPTTGIVNFTPTNDDVGIYANSWAIVKETDTGNGSIAIITWTIINVNDAPNITSWYPQNLTNVTEKEGWWINFNVTVDDPDLIYDDTLNYTWLIDGVINKSVLNYTDNTANYTPNYFSNGTHYVTVNVTDNASASTSITWTVNITNENRAPVNNATILNISMIEDTGNYSVINLSEYFYDNDTDDTLSYDFVYVTGHNVTVLISLTEPFNATILPYLNFFGTNTIRFRCFDGYNYTSSNNVTINVTGVNDLPIVQQVQNQTAYAGTLKTISVFATDPDNDPLTYYDNTTLFNINPATGLISFTPVTGDIGNYSILINVSDGVTNISMIFNLSVINNTAPVLGGKPLPDIVTTEGNLTALYFNATDIDEDDLLTFTTGCVPSNAKICNIITTNNSNENGRAQITFTPNQTDIDAPGPVWTVTVTVNDSKGSTDSDTFTITIIDTEHYPQLSPYPIPNQKMKVNKTFSMYVYASDDDGNLNVFGDDTTLFNIITLGSDGYAKTGRINFTPNASDIGEYWVNITVNDDTGRYNWSLALFNVTPNTPPTIQPIPNQTAIEDQLFTYLITASDEDPQDTLNYSHNGTYNGQPMFNITSTGLISFTPNSSHTGSYEINISVTDGEATAWTMMNLTIGSYNDFPYWVPPLEAYYVNETTYLNTTHWNSTNILSYATNMTVWNSTLYEKNYTFILLDAYDEEFGTSQFTVFPAIEDQLDFFWTFINFTNASNDTVTSGITLFDVTHPYYTGHNALINFTPTNAQVGVYYVNITVDDTTGRSNTSTVRIEVFNVNDAPVITGHTPDVTDYQNMTENSSMMFSVSAMDPDYGDSLHYQWALNGTNISGANQSQYNYTTDFFSAGWRNVTVFVLDRQNTSTPLNWTINVSNVNRMGWFGQLREYNYTHFNAGVTKNNVTVMPLEEGVILSNSTPTAYRTNGMFESAVRDTTETNNHHEYSTINWTGNTTPPLQAQYSLYFQTRTKNCLPTQCLWSQYNESVFYMTSNVGIIATAPAERYIQYRFFLQTNNTQYTPQVNTVTLGYKIKDKTQEQNTNQTLIDLDSYFFEPDIDDNVTFNATTPNGTAVTDVNITINPSVPHRVFIATNSIFKGATQVVFHMSDGYNTTDSNVININVTEAVTTPQVIMVPMGGGGGGAVSMPVPYEVPTYITSPVAFRLIAPQMVTTYANATMEVPINLFNEGNFTLANVKLNASSPNKDVTIRLSKEHFDTIKGGQKEFVTLTVESYKTYGTYEILVEASADATSIADDGTEKISTFHERAKVFVNSLLKASGNESQVNTKLAFAEDLLSNNPECLELNEFMKKAKQAVAEGNKEKAENLLDQVVESCKYLIAPREKRPEIETPAKVYGMPTESLFIIGTVGFVTLLVAIAIVIGWAHIKARKQEMMKRKL